MFKLNTKPEGKKTEFEPLPMGSYTGILKGGYVKKLEDAKYQKTKTNILLRWEVLGVTYLTEEGETLPRCLFLYETLSTGDKSNFHRILLSNLGSDDIGMTFEEEGINPFGLPDFEKHNLTGFYLNDVNLFETEFEILAGRPKGASTFNELHSISLAAPFLSAPQQQANGLGAQNS